MEAEIREKKIMRARTCRKMSKTGTDIGTTQEETTQQEPPTRTNEHTLTQQEQPTGTTPHEKTTQQEQPTGTNSQEETTQQEPPIVTNKPSLRYYWENVKNNKKNKEEG